MTIASFHGRTFPSTGRISPISINSPEFSHFIPKFFQLFTLSSSLLFTPINHPMAPKVRGGLGKRASSSRGNHSTPDKEFANREIKAECHLDTEPNRMTEWTINLLTSMGLLNIMVPAANIYYPRLVALFYQNIVQISNSPLTLATTVDNIEIIISEETVAEALGIPVRRPIDSNFHEPGDVPWDDLYTSLQVRGKRIEHKIDHVNMPQELWFLSYIFYKNVIMLGHKTERRRPVLDLLYYAYNATWFSPVGYIIENMLQIHTKCSTRSISGGKQHLLYPFLITKLLLNQGFLFDSGEPFSKTTGKWDFKKSFNQSVANIKKSKALASQGASSSTAGREEDLEYVVSSEESDGGPTREEFNSMSDAIDEIRTSAFDTRHLLDSLIHIQYPDNEARIREDYESRRSHRRGH